MSTANRNQGCPTGPRLHEFTRHQYSLLVKGGPWFIQKRNGGTTCGEADDGQLLPLATTERFNFSIQPGRLNFRLLDARNSEHFIHGQLRKTVIPTLKQTQAESRTLPCSDIANGLSHN